MGPRPFPAFLSRPVACNGYRGLDLQPPILRPGAFLQRSWPKPHLDPCIGSDAFWADAARHEQATLRIQRCSFVRRLFHPPFFSSFSSSFSNQKETQVLLLAKKHQRSFTSSLYQETIPIMKASFILAGLPAGLTFALPYLAPQETPMQKQTCLATLKHSSLIARESCHCSVSGALSSPAEATYNYNVSREDCVDWCVCQLGTETCHSFSWSPNSRDSNAGTCKVFGAPLKQMGYEPSSSGSNAEGMFTFFPDE